MAMKVIKIAPGTWANDSHDKRELSVLRELGAEIEVVAKGDRSGQVDEVDSYPVCRRSTRPVKWFPVSVNRVISLFTWAGYVRGRDADIISGHDLIGLLIGWMSNVGKRHKAKLVYDSHEFELGRNENRSRLTLWAICRLEGFLMKRCAFSLMVNEAIADEVQRIHKLQEKPITVRNIPPYWELDEAATAKTRADLLSRLHAPSDAFLVLYHGVLTQGRGIENLLRATALNQKNYAVVLGNGADPAYVDGLHHLCGELGISDRVLFHPAVPIAQLRNYVSACDVGLVALVATCQNHTFTLPNKFFESIQSMTPVIVSDFPSIGSIVDQYGIGLRVDPESPEAISRAFDKMRTDTAFYNTCKANLNTAKRELCWERERTVLMDAYRRILP